MSDYQILEGENAVRFERLLPGPIQRVWLYLVESELRQKWLASGDLDLSGEHPTDMLFRHKDITSDAPPEQYAKVHEEGHLSHWKVTACEPPRLLRVLWGSKEEDDSEVTFELREEGDKVRLILTHRLLEDKKAMANVSGGWHAHLRVLEQRLLGLEPTDFWKTVLEEEAGYKKKLGVE